MPRRPHSNLVVATELSHVRQLPAWKRIFRDWVRHKWLYENIYRFHPRYFTSNPLGESGRQVPFFRFLMQLPRLVDDLPERGDLHVVALLRLWAVRHVRSVLARFLEHPQLRQVMQHDSNFRYDFEAEYNRQLQILEVYENQIRDAWGDNSA